MIFVTLRRFYWWRYLWIITELLYTYKKNGVFGIHCETEIVSNFTLKIRPFAVIEFEKQSFMWKASDFLAAVQESLTGKNEFGLICSSSVICYQQSSLILISMRSLIDSNSSCIQRWFLVVNQFSDFIQTQSDFEYSDIVHFTVAVISTTADICGTEDQLFNRILPNHYLAITVWTPYQSSIVVHQELIC